MSEKELFLDFRVKEFQATQRALRAMPFDQMEFRPHERSRSARELVTVLIREEFINKGLAGAKMGPPDLSSLEAENLADLVSNYETLFNQVTEEIKNLPDGDFNQKVEFYGNTVRRGEAFWWILFDTIHHRGQLSVYIRMAGGKVPSIYGPSADEQ